MLAEFNLPSIYTPANKSERRRQVEHVIRELKSDTKSYAYKFHMELKLHSLLRQQLEDSACKTPSSKSETSESDTEFSTVQGKLQSMSLPKPQQLHEPISASSCKLEKPSKAEKLAFVGTPEPDSSVRKSTVSNDAVRLSNWQRVSKSLNSAREYKKDPRNVLQKSIKQKKVFTPDTRMFKEFKPKYFCRKSASAKGLSPCAKRPCTSDCSDHTLLQSQHSKVQAQLGSNENIVSTLGTMEQYGHQAEHRPLLAKYIPYWEPSSDIKIVVGPSGKKNLFSDQIVGGFKNEDKRDCPQPSLYNNQQRSHRRSSDYDDEERCETVPTRLRGNKKNRRVWGDNNVKNPSHLSVNMFPCSPGCRTSNSPSYEYPTTKHQRHKLHVSNDHVSEQSYSQYSIPSSYYQPQRYPNTHWSLRYWKKERKSLLWSGYQQHHPPRCRDLREPYQSSEYGRGYYYPYEHPRSHCYLEDSGEYEFQHYERQFHDSDYHYVRQNCECDNCYASLPRYDDGFYYRRPVSLADESSEYTGAFQLTSFGPSTNPDKLFWESRSNYHAAAPERFFYLEDRYRTGYHDFNDRVDGYIYKRHKAPVNDSRNRIFESGIQDYDLRSPGMPEQRVPNDSEPIESRKPRDMEVEKGEPSLSLGTPSFGDCDGERSLDSGRCRDHNRVIGL